MQGNGRKGQKCRRKQIHRSVEQDGMERRKGTRRNLSKVIGTE